MGLKNYPYSLQECLDIFLLQKYSHWYISLGLPDAKYFVSRRHMLRNRFLCHFHPFELPLCVSTETVPAVFLLDLIIAVLFILHGVVVNENHRPHVCPLF